MTRKKIELTKWDLGEAAYNYYCATDPLYVYQKANELYDVGGADELHDVTLAEIDKAFTDHYFAIVDDLKPCELQAVAVALGEVMHKSPTRNEIRDNMANDYLTINEGRDGKDYAWYCDDIHSIAVDIETLDIIDDEEKIDALFC